MDKHKSKEKLKKANIELKKYIKDLDYDNFVDFYESVDDPFELDCMATELFKHYPEVLCSETLKTSTDFDMELFNKTKKEIIDKLNMFFEFLIENGFTFNCNILCKRFDEPIHFFQLFDAIGLEQQTDVGNTILHMQVRGLHYEGVEFLLKNGANPNICNQLNQNCFDLLFIDNFISYYTANAFERKKNIGELLIKHGAETNRIIGDKNLFDRALYHCFVNNNGKSKWEKNDIMNLIIIKDLIGLNEQEINKSLAKFLEFLEKNKHIYPNEGLYMLDRRIILDLNNIIH